MQTAIYFHTLAFVGIKLGDQGNHVGFVEAIGTQLKVFLDDDEASSGHLRKMEGHATGKCIVGGMKEVIEWFGALKVASCHDERADDIAIDLAGADDRDPILLRSIGSDGGPREIVRLIAYTNDSHGVQQEQWCGWRLIVEGLKDLNTSFGSTKR